MVIALLGGKIEVIHRRGAVLGDADAVAEEGTVKELSVAVAGVGRLFGGSGGPFGIGLAAQTAAEADGQEILGLDAALRGGDPETFVGLFLISRNQTALQIDPAQFDLPLEDASAGGPLEKIEPLSRLGFLLLPSNSWAPFQAI